MNIRKTTPADLDTVMDIYAYARQQMANNGNPDQWGTVHPPRGLIEEDIRAGRSYVCVTDDDVIAAVFYFAVEEDPTYAHIDGAWLKENAPYGVVHRIARAAEGKGAGAVCLAWCLAQCGNVRIDTHEHNVPTLRLLEKLGYTRCGVIRLGLFDAAAMDERVAFQKVIHD